MVKSHLTLSRLAGAMALASAVIGVPMAEARSTLIGGVPADATIMRAGSAAQKVAGIRNVPTIGVINLRNEAIRSFTYPGAYTDTIQEYRLTVDRNAGAIAKLKAALKANPVTRRALATHGVNINRIVALDIGSNGSLRVYVL